MTTKVVLTSCVCTVPIREKSTSDIPFGALAIVQKIIDEGHVSELYNLDYLRPTWPEIESFFKEKQFDIVGISGVVSTSYAYSKKLAETARRMMPDCVIILGGRLAASAEVVLRKTEIDYCVIGAGEPVLEELLPLLQADRDHNDDELKRIYGLCFVGEDNEFNFNGYGQKRHIKNTDIPNYNLLSHDSVKHYFVPVEKTLSGKIPESIIGKNEAVVQMSNGCHGHCTFCHRWEKGYIMRPLEQIKEWVGILKKEHNVGYLNLRDENFGANRKSSLEIAKLMHDEGFFWRAGGVRVDSVTPEILRQWKDYGCTHVVYGIESGSQKILDVMEKRVTVAQNIQAIEWALDLGMRCYPQFVLGMPGETDQTIDETTRFVIKLIPKLHLDGVCPSSQIYIKLAMALPGTPLYEYLRSNGRIGSSIDEEEKYLIYISDTQAYSQKHYINSSDFPLLKCFVWESMLRSKIDAFYLMEIQKIKLSVAEIFLLITKKFFDYLKINFGNKKIKDVLDSKPNYFAPLHCHPLTSKLSIPLIIIGTALRAYEFPFSKRLLMIFDHAIWSIGNIFTHAGNKVNSEPDRGLRSYVSLYQQKDGIDNRLLLRIGQ